MNAQREQWLETYLEARLWYCEDEECDCHQPQIDRVMPNHEAGYPFIQRQRLFSGTFYSRPSGTEMAELKEQLAFEAKRLGIDLDMDGYAYVPEKARGGVTR